MGKSAVFRSRFTARFDDRGRIRLPSRFLEIIEATYNRELYLTSLNGDHILCYPLKVWEGIEERIERIQLRGPEIEEFLNRTSYFGSETEIDPKGRILVPAYLRERCQLSESAFLLGKVDHWVIWNEEQFVARNLAGTFDDEKLRRVAALLHDGLPLPGHAE